MVELAYRLAVSEQPMIRRIREKVVVLINPVSNPDGRAKMSDWFYRYLKGQTDFAELPRQSPPYWGRYVFVDMNRDAHQQTQRETQAIYRMFLDYHPVVIHDLHESIALLQTWNGTGPYNPNLDPIVTSAFLEMSFHEVTTLTALGMPGVWTWDFGDGFGHHYVDSIAMNHNASGAATRPSATPPARPSNGFSSPTKSRRAGTARGPPPDPVEWSMRNNVNYPQTGLLAVLDYAAATPRTCCAISIAPGSSRGGKGVAGNPYAFVIREDQPDRLRVAQMVNLLRLQGIEVARSTQAFTIEGEFPAALSSSVSTSPTANYAVDLLSIRTSVRPRRAALRRRVVGAAGPLGVETIRVDDPRVRDVALDPVAPTWR